MLDNVNIFIHVFSDLKDLESCGLWKKVYQIVNCVMFKSIKKLIHDKQFALEVKNVKLHNCFNCIQGALYFMLCFMLLWVCLVQYILNMTSKDNDFSDMYGHNKHMWYPRPSGPGALFLLINFMAVRTSDFRILGPSTHSGKLGIASLTSWHSFLVYSVLRLKIGSFSISMLSTLGLIHPERVLSRRTEYTRKLCHDVREAMPSFPESVHGRPQNSEIRGPNSHKDDKKKQGT